MAEISAKSAQTPGEKVKRLMKECHYTQAKLAELLDCSENHISMMVRGERNLTVKNAKKIADLFGVRFQWLLGFDDCKTDQDKIGQVAQSALENGVAAHTLMQLAATLLGYTLEESTAAYTDNEEGVIQFDPDRIAYYIIKDGVKVLPILESEYERIRNEIVRYIAFLIEGLVHDANGSWHPFSITREDIYGG